VVELAAWLHDLAAVRDFATLPTHARDGARLAGEWLALQGLPAPRVEAVRRCVASHSAPVAPGAGTVEEVCLSNADVLAQLARPAYWFHYLHDVRGLSREEGRPWFRARATEVWTALAPEARALALAERAAVLGMVGPATGANGDHPAATASSGPAAASLAGQATPQAAQWSR
jgi:predicted metal-dependent HD superfamily phosphohydrolase